MHETNAMSETTPTNAPTVAQAATADPDEINLLDLWRVLVKRCRLIALLFFAATVATSVISLLLPKTYQAKTTIMPLESSKTGPSTALAALGGMVGISLRESAPTEKPVAVPNSRTVKSRASGPDYQFLDRRAG